MSLFWLTYRHPDGRAAGVVVIESAGLLHARLTASLAGADRDLEFLSGHKLDQDSARQIPEKMMGRILDGGDLRKLHQMLLKKKPPAPSVRRQTAIKRSVGKSMTRRCPPNRKAPASGRKTGLWEAEGSRKTLSQRSNFGTLMLDRKFMI